MLKRCTWIFRRAKGRLVRMDGSFGTIHERLQNVRYGSKCNCCCSSREAGRDVDFFVSYIFARGEVAQGAVDMFDSSLLIREEKTRHQFKSKAAHSAKEYINWNSHVLTYNLHSLTSKKKLFKSKKCTRLSRHYTRSIPSPVSFLSTHSSLQQGRVFSNARDEIEFLWSTFTWVEQFNIWII